MPENDFDLLQSTLSAAGIDAALEMLAARLEARKQYHELFDARLMQARRKLGLPIILTATLDELPEPARTQVEDAYLAACREVGDLLLSAGMIRQSWMYLRPLADNAALAARLAAIEPDEENLEELIELTLHEGVSPVLGLKLVLGHYGICNAITLYESAFASRTRLQRQQAAELLVRHIHEEISHNVREDIARQEGQQPTETTLAGLIAARDWLFLNDNYHADTTHLASVVRFAEIIETPDVLRLAIELTAYGQRLNAQFQFAGDEPFVDLYPSHALFFHALQGEELEPALKYFGAQAETVETRFQGTAAIDAYVYLLARTQRYREAVEATIRLLPPGARGGQAPSLLELSRLAGDYAPLMQQCRQRDDLLGFAAGLAQASS